MHLFSFSRLRVVLAVTFATTVATTLASCTLRTSVQPSVLVVMVERLGFGAFSCGEDSGSGQVSGFQTFCEEGVRFTHAYTPSVLSQPAIASILTAKYPFEHGVRDNGASFLAARENTIAEWALRFGYRTAFYSGGPPIWRKSGFNQGFEIFDDNVPIGPKRFYRPAHDVVRMFLDWQDNEAPRGRFFGMLYFSDLQFTDVPTQNEIGEEREKSYSSQLAEVDEALGNLIKEVKRRKIWNSNNVVLVGLNALPSSGRIGEIPALNLYSESTRTTLMIKPTRKDQDGPFNWKIDANVSLVDVGRTVFDVIGVASEKTSASSASVSLKGAFASPENDWPDDRRIVTESAWAKWRDQGGIRAAVRSGPYLYLFDQSDLLYDTLTDNMELSPLPSSDSRSAKLRWELSSYLREVGYLPWVEPNRATVEKANLGRELWRDRPIGEDTLKRLRKLAKESPEDEELSGWRAIWALERSDWSELKDVAAKSELNADWLYVASLNVPGKEPAPMPKNPCLMMSGTIGRSRTVTKECRVNGVQDLLDWADESTSEANRNRAMDAFLRAYVKRTLVSRVDRQNQVVGLVWDAAPRIYGPDTLDLVLALPEMKRYRAIVRTRVASERRQ